MDRAQSLDRVSEEESEKDEHENQQSEDCSPENDDGASEIVAGPGCITHETRDEPVPSDREMDPPQPDTEDTISQPIPFQMGLTPQEEPQVEDELTDWYETSASGARSSTTPAAKAKPAGRRERSPRNLRNRQVARSIRPEQKVHWNLQAQKREFEKTMTVEQMKMEWDLQQTEYIQLNLDRQHAIMEQYPKWHTKWSLLNDPVGRGMSEVLNATIQNVRAQRKEMKKARKVIPLDPFHMQSEYTVLSAQLTKLIDKQERSYQKVFLNSICGQGELLNSTNHILNTIEEMGQTHRQHRRKNHSVNKIVHNSPESVHPWLPLIHQTKLMEQEVPAYFQQGSNLQTQYVNEEEVLQTTTCSTKDLQEDMEGWKKAFEKELNSFDRLNVKTDVWESTLDLRKVEILPGKVVMVKKPIGDGTHLKKGRVVVCGNFQQVQPGEETCANTPSFPMLRTLISLASLQRWAVASWDVSTAFLYAQLPEDHVVYCHPPNALIRLGLVQPGVVWKLNKALYGLRTSPKAWEEERDEKLQNLTWSLNGQQVGLCKVDSTNCVWTIREKTPHGFQGEPLGMVIAYVDDLIAVGQQEQLDGMKASLDALYTMKTSGTVPAEYTPGIEPLKFLGCFIERISTGEIIMHQRSYIEHCLKNNEMTQLKVAKSLPCVDEKSPPEDAFDEHGHPTSFEEDKSMCQKYIGQLMWLTTRTRPDIAAVLGSLASQMVVRPTYIKGCLIHLWRYVLGTINLNMYSFEPAPMQYGSLILNVYVDASFASGGGRSRSGLAMYLVNPTNGKESIIQWASRRQTSMATSAPEAEVSAMAEGFAASIFLFDTLSEIGLVSGSGPSSIMSMKTDSAVALKQLGMQSVTVRTRTAAQKLNYLRELIYDDPQIEPIYISGDSQRADGLTKILSGSALRECQEGLNLKYPSEQNEGHDSQEEKKKKAEKPEQAKIGACIVSRQAEGESSSLDSTQVGSSDSSVVLAPVCLVCQEGQVQVRKSESMCIMFSPRSHYMVREKGDKKKGRPGGEAPEGQAHAHGPGPGVKQKQEIAEAKMKALQHTGVPSSSSTSSSAKVPKTKGKQTSQSVQEHQQADLAMSQASVTESASAAAPAVESSSSSSSSSSTAVAAAVAALESASSASELASVLEEALGATPQDVQMTPQIEEDRRVSSQSWADITAQDEEEDQKSKKDQNTGVQTGDQELAWSRVLNMTDEDLRKDTSRVDRSQLNTYHFDASLVNTSPEETSFSKPAELPAWTVREEFLNKLNACKFLVVKAPTGSGKSTIFPALAAKVMPKDRVMCTQVKRNTTEAVCHSTRKMWRRSPQDLVVGFKHGTSDRQTSANEKTRILFCTEGIARNEIFALDRTKVADTAIRGCRILLVDEAHSNNVDTE